LRPVPLVLLALLAQAPQTDRPVFRAGTSLVRLDVRIVDESGRPIRDIRPDEIRVTESDATRPILLFQRVAGLDGSYAEAAERTIASDVSTNQGAPQGQLFVLIFDQEHIRSGGEQPVRVAADAFLRDRVRPQDRVAIYGLPGPGPAQPFTAEMAVARRQLGSVRGGLERRASGAVSDMAVSEAYEIIRGNEQVLARFTTQQASDLPASGASAAATDLSRRFADEPAVFRRLLRENAQSIVNRADAEARRFLQAMAALLRGFRGIDGRKTVVVFSEGFYGDNVSRDIEDVASAAAETYSVVYAFDLNRRVEVTAAASTADNSAEISSRLEPLGSLAAETSGDLVKDTIARLDTALSILRPDDGGYYLVGFEPAMPGPGDSLYRRIKVHVDRPGARVVSRTGYAVGAALTPADRRRAIDTALVAPFTQQGLKLEYTTYVGQSAVVGQQRVAVSLVAELPVRPAAGAGIAQETDGADVVFMVRNSRGQVVASGSDLLPLPARTEAGFSTGASRWRVAFDLPAGEYRMRCVVREPGGIVGSADRRFTVRLLGGPEVAATDLLLHSPGDPLAVRVRGFTEGTLTGTVRLHGPDAPALQNVAARLEITPAGGTLEPGAVGRVSEATLGEVLVSGRGFMRDVMFAVPLERLAAGPYVARAVVRVSGEVVADLRRPLDVTIGSPPAPLATDAPRRPRDAVDGSQAARMIRQAASNPSERIRRAASSASEKQWAAVLAELDGTAADDSVANQLRGLALLGREDYRGAAATLGLAFARQGDAALAFVLGWALIGAEDRTGAVTAFRNAVIEEPTMTAAHLALAETYVSLGNPALAVQALETGLRAVPDSIEIQDLLATLKKKE
jgi:VWFA-related protein